MFLWGAGEIEQVFWKRAVLRVSELTPIQDQEIPRAESSWRMYECCRGGIVDLPCFSSSLHVRLWAVVEAGHWTEWVVVLRP